MKTIITKNIIKEFEEHLRSEEKSECTIGKYLHDVKMFSNFIGNNSVTKQSLIDFKTSLIDKYRVASANSMIAAVNSFLKFIKLDDYSVKQFKVQRKTFCSEENELTKAEYVRLVNTAKRKNNNRLCLILQTICSTGIRVSELQFITVGAVKKGYVTVSCKNKTRTIFIVRALQKKLLNYITREGITRGSVFVTRTGKSMNRCAIWREMKSLCKEACVSASKTFPHNLRHLFARVFYAIEKDIAKLADILGHSSIDTTRIYIITTGKEHRRKMEKMNLIL